MQGGDNDILSFIALENVLARFAASQEAGAK
jgi:hypothetical protein